MEPHKKKRKHGSSNGNEDRVQPTEDDDPYGVEENVKALEEHRRKRVDAEKRVQNLSKAMLDTVREDAVPETIDVLAKYKRLRDDLQIELVDKMDPLEKKRRILEDWEESPHWEKDDATVDTIKANALATIRREVEDLDKEVEKLNNDIGARTVKITLFEEQRASLQTARQKEGEERAKVEKELASLVKTKKRLEQVLSDNPSD